MRFTNKHEKFKVRRKVYHPGDDYPTFDVKHSRTLYDRGMLEPDGKLFDAQVIKQTVELADGTFENPDGSISLFNAGIDESETIATPRWSE